jgi:hypothetical protein
MSAFNFFVRTPKFSIFTIFVMLPDELFVTFEIICSTLTRFWCGQEELRDPALLILLTGVYFRFLSCEQNLPRWMQISLMETDFSFKFIQLQHSYTHMNMYFMNNRVQNGPVHSSKWMRDWYKWNINTLQALLRNFLLTDMSQVMLNSVLKIE